ncbi:SAM-dependent methyltransferase [Clostridium thermosuccinogenes]|uniref:SAM-dependent methyltransferase n=1 Tax=Clostridium thermosuccinogenes TaxID=84032 RepID=A0A2K2FC74_9CLOT|nr:class I SAM-dependent methyltransferase [Pseudoclostridium thermosuccinogenes]AUS96239.1 SAM-dependent methyltransferase [Pseudoclostridium thermosuccinogenes]PNT93081.1 SAM-dependent methyltransferase [Pseudoclostridium thermosuccinogenes]PNT96386.1 SAM-dependent methyltransferase [Pseudoclostridium thermosuccinogenes]PNT98039.1 SAM-dependent methyltransferase [Pseudoclostridium thermosuccinogenes]
MRNKDVIKNSLGQSHEIIEKVVKPGDVVIDATAGNGYDTVFLAKLVGETGRVYSFDIQEQAILNTRKKLEDLGLAGRVVQIKDGHQNMDLYVKEKVKAVMFNLGYLPGGDHSIGTKADTTIAAIKKALQLIQVNGIVTVVVYYGGDSGFDEKEAVMEFIKGIEFRQFNVMKTEFVNQPNCPPILVCMEKLFE